MSNIEKPLLKTLDSASKNVYVPTTSIHINSESLCKFVDGFTDASCKKRVECRIDVDMVRFTPGTH